MARLRITWLFGRLLHTHQGRYLLVGGSIYLVEMLVLVVAQLLDVQAMVAVGISFGIGLVLSFFLQKIVTFGDQRMHRHILLPQIILVSLLILFNFLFTLALTRALAGLLSVFVIRTIALGTTTLWNFYLYKTRIFKTSEAIPVD